MTMILDGTLGETFPSWTTAGRPASPAVGQMGYNTTIGQFDAYTAAGWVSVATTTSTSNKVTTSQLPVGTVLQVVSANYSTLTTTTNPTVGVYATGLSASITPTSSSSKVLVISSNEAWLSASAPGTYYGHFILNKNGSSLVDFGTAEWVYGPSMNEIGFRGVEIYLDAPATTSSTTYSITFALDSAIATGSLVRNRNNAPATMILMEIAA
jgi:hypothetical protein